MWMCVCVCVCMCVCVCVCVHACVYVHGWVGVQGLIYYYVCIEDWYPVHALDNSVCLVISLCKQFAITPCYIATVCVEVTIFIAHCYLPVT